MTDWVSVRNLRLQGFHGVFPEERRSGQEFEFDIHCAVDASACARDDDYESTVCYSSLCDLAKGVSQEGPFRLIETLADRLAQRILERFAAATRVVVKVRKPSAPINARFDWVGVKVDRRRRRRIALSLGSCAGHRSSNLRAALAHLDAKSWLDIERVSGFYQIAPLEEQDQRDSLHACVIGWATREPDELFSALKRVELAVCRRSEGYQGSGMIDIDLLFVDDLEIRTPRITLPHPEMFNRSTVLVPLAEIAEDQIVLGRGIGEAAAALSILPDAISRADV